MRGASTGLRFRSLRLAWGAAILAVLAGPPRISAQTRDAAQTPASAPGTANESPFQVQVRSNLVVVRVVVRDAQGKPVQGLKKEDFHLFDRGKEQAIAQFEVETSVPQNTASLPTPGPAQPKAPAMPGKFLALYFDDLNTSDTDMMQARDAADHYLTTNLQPKDRVAIFTSAKVLSDFTADPKQIHEALFKLRTSARALNRIRQCPDLSDYQAAQISQFQDDPEIDAWKIALDEMAHDPTCPKGGPDPNSYIVMLARNIVAQAEIQAQTSLQELERMVQYMSQMPGPRTIIMVSPGFLSQSEQYQLDRIIDRALRSQVVISSLDPKGLALLMRETDVTRSYTPMAGPVMGAIHSVDSTREFTATDVLAELAQGTGGEFFHNNNDLKAGFGALAGSSVYYILAFAPADVKPDGRFHALKVTLTEKQRGMTIQARRGYFAPKNEAEAEADAKQQAISDSEAQAQEQIREAVLSQTDVRQFPVGLSAKLSEGKEGKRELALFAHLDATPLHFHKDGDHNLNTVTFVFAIFDQKDKLVDSQQRRALVSVLDTQLPQLFKEGVDADMTFHLKPGVYRIREVVTDSEEHHMTAFSKDVKIP